MYSRSNKLLCDREHDCCKDDHKNHVFMKKRSCCSSSWKRHTGNQHHFLSFVQLDQLKLLIFWQVGTEATVASVFLKKQLTCWSKLASQDLLGPTCFWTQRSQKTEGVVKLFLEDRDPPSSLLSFNCPCLITKVTLLSKNWCRCFSGAVCVQVCVCFCVHVCVFCRQCCCWMSRFLLGPGAESSKLMKLKLQTCWWCSLLQRYFGGTISSIIKLIKGLKKANELIIIDYSL